MQDLTVFIQNHWQLSSVLIVVLILLTIVEFIKQKSDTSRLTPRQVTQLINHENAAVVDVRDTDAFASGHILNAASLPVKDLEQKLQKIEKFKSQPIVLVCSTGLDSARAFSVLQKKGFNVKILGGGIRAWREADLPLVKN